MSEKIELKDKLAAVDMNYKGLWDEIDEDQRKNLKQEFFILNRYISSAKTNSRDAKEHYVLAVNEYFNKYWNDLQGHPQLMWQLLCMCGHESKSIFFHEWIGFKKKDAASNKMTKFLSSIFPVSFPCRRESSHYLLTFDPIFLIMKIWLTILILLKNRPTMQQQIHQL